MSAATRFGVVVPVGAWTPRLAATLRSLRRQTAPVAVALHDASGDSRVVALADQFADLIQVRRHAPDDGQAGAIADGWAALDADVLGWLNADDYLAPAALSAAVAVLEAEAADAVSGQSLILDPDGAPLGWHPAVAPVGPGILRGCTVSQPSCFVRRAAIDAAGGLDRTLHYTMDWDLWVRLFQSGARFAHLDAPLSAVIWARETKTSSFNRARRSEIAALVRRTSGRVAAMKSLIGFGLHHVATYSAPRRLLDTARAAARTAGHAATAVHGWRMDGVIDPAGAWLPVFHEDVAPWRGLALDIDGPVEVSVELRAADAVLASVKGRGRMEIGASLEPGVLYSLATTSTAAARVLRVSPKKGAADEPAKAAPF